MPAARDIVKRLTVRPGRTFSLKDIDPGFTASLRRKKTAEAELADSTERLRELQAQLYAQNAYAVLLIFQGMDAAGKDGTIRHVMSGVDPQGCQVFSFKAPSAEELDHTYLWRSMKALPERGRIGIHNRSYYEEVLVVRVHPEFLAAQHLPDAVVRGRNIWKDRFRQINDFERYLAENGTVVLKFFMHVSKAEQRRRFLERLDDPGKNWKFSLGDVRERELWSAYQAAYEDALRHTSTTHAPWHVIPSDHKWFARLAVSTIINARLESLGLTYPTVSKTQRGELKRARAALVRER